MRAVLVFVCAFVVAGAACKRDKDRAKPEPVDDAATVAPVDERPYHIVLTNVSIETIDPKTVVDVHVRELTAAVASKLTKSDQFAHAASAVPDHARPREASLELVITYDSTADTVSVDVESVLIWDDAGDELIPRQNMVAERPLEGGDRAAATAAFVAEIVERSADALIAKEAIRTGEAANVATALTADDPEMVRWALDVARDRRLAEAYDPVLALLASKDRDTHIDAIRALVAIGDSRAVDPIAKSGEFSDHKLIETIIDAVSTLGGEDARVYLEFIAAGHPDIGIRDKAARALGE
jgi:hypothetical protein